MTDSVSNADLKRAKRARPQQATGVDRLPPNSEEAERAVLSCILLAPNECLPECIDRFKAAPGTDIFYDLRHQTIYDTMVEMFDERKGIDVITLQQRLKDKQLLEQVGGLAYLSPLPDMVPSVVNISYYIEHVWEKMILRNMIRLCTDVVGRIYDTEGELEVLMDEVERDILNIVGHRMGHNNVLVKEAVKQAIGHIENLHQSGGKMGIMTGFADLDKMTCGLQPPDMIVLAARPSVGKTALLLNIVDHVAVEQRIPVGIFSLEMSTMQLVLRMICARARIDGQKVREGFITQGDFPKITAAAGKLANAPLYIDDTGGLSLTQFRSKARRMVQLYGIKLIGLDYMQLLHAPGKKSENRQQEMTTISTGIKELAKELKIPIIALSQLNRELEKSGGKKAASRKPRMSDIRESGSIEQDADLIGLLYRPEEGSSTVNLDIAKQRNGPTGLVQLVYLKEQTRFESAAKIKDDDLPPC